MSGNVLKLNEDDEEDDDVAGLLVRRGDDEDDDDDTTAQGLGDGGRRGAQRQRQQAKKYARGGSRRRSDGDSLTMARSSGLAQLLLHTLALCCVFFAMGFTKSLLEVSSGPDLPSHKEVAAAVGNVLGYIIGGLFLSKLSQTFLILMTMSVMSVMLLMVPWTTSAWATDSVYGVTGATLALLMIEGNVLCFDFWGRRSGPYIQALHFCLSLGLLTGPLMVDPLSQARVPVIVQKALPLTPTKVSDVAAVTTIIPTLAAKYANSHVLIKRSFPDNDPILAQLFASPNSTSATTPLIPLSIPMAAAPTKGSRITVKPKPIFTDARKLDNSRDWETVKVAAPPEEELKAPDSIISTSTYTSATDPVLELLKATTSDSPIRAEIRMEIESLTKDIENNEQMLHWLASSSSPGSGLPRLKRSVPPRDDFGDPVQPPLYSQPLFSRQHSRVPPSTGSQWKEHRVSMGSPVGGWPRSHYQDYPVDGDYANMFEQPSSDTLPPPPERVEKAFETIKEYLRNPESSQAPSTTARVTVGLTTATESSHQPSSTTTSATLAPVTATATTASTTTSRSGTSLSPSWAVSGDHQHKKKPMSSYDNDTDADLTLQAVLTNYGVSQMHLGFVFDAAYCLLMSLLLLLCSCYRPREPRSRLPMAQIHLQGACHSSSGSMEERIFEATVVGLLFLFNLVHWGMFVSFRRVLPTFRILESSAVYLERIFVGVFTATRFLAIFLSGLARPATALFCCLTVVCLGSLILVFTQQVSVAAVWTGVILLAVGLSALLPISLQWGESYVLMSPPVVATVCWGLGLGQLVIPHVLVLLTTEAQTWLGFASLGAASLCFGLFLCVFLIARRHGTRFTQPQASGYELASQVEQNEELLSHGDADEDDEDDFEVTEATLQLAA